MKNLDPADLVYLTILFKDSDPTIKLIQIAHIDRLMEIAEEFHKKYRNTNWENDKEGWEQRMINFYNQHKHHNWQAYTTEEEETIDDRHFPNGFDAWQETHYEMVERITIEHMKDNPQGIIAQRHAAQGHGGLYKLAEEWTDEFEKLNEGRKWDGEFFDQIDEFLESKK